MELFTQAFLKGAALEEGPDGVVQPGPDPLRGVGLMTTTLGINIKQHPKYPNLYHFSYDQLESPKDNPIVQECRGLILDSTDNWKVVAFPFKRFANYGESWTAPVDWKKVRVQEKVDGSLMILWFYGGEWNISTKGSPDAGGQVGDYGFTFAELFWKTFSRVTQFDCTMSTNVSAWFNPEYTYMMELTSIYNRVVCAYGKEPMLTFLGARHINEYPYQEYSASVFDTPIPVVKEFPLTSPDEILKAAEALNPMENEGFVVVDHNFNRCKIKSPSYVMIHHMKDGFGQRRIIRLIQLGEQSEVLSYFPEYQDLFNEIKVLIDAKLAEIDGDFHRIRHIQDQKEFALEATKTKHPDVLFQLRKRPDIDAREMVLHSRKAIKGGTEEMFAYSEEKIERLVGLKARLEVPVEQ